MVLHCHSSAALLSQVLPSRNMMSMVSQPFLQLLFVYLLPMCHIYCPRSESLLFSSSELLKPKYSVSLLPTHYAVFYRLYLPYIFVLVSCLCLQYLYLYSSNIVQHYSFFIYIFLKLSNSIDCGPLRFCCVFNSCIDCGHLGSCCVFNSCSDSGPLSFSRVFNSCIDCGSLGFSRVFNSCIDCGSLDFRRVFNSCIGCGSLSFSREFNSFIYCGSLGFCCVFNSYFINCQYVSHNMQQYEHVIRCQSLL